MTGRIGTGGPGKWPGGRYAPLDVRFMPHLDNGVEGLTSALHHLTERVLERYAGSPTATRGLSHISRMWGLTIGINNDLCPIK